MRKTFCDGCGIQVKNTTVHLHGAIEHQTNQGEQVGYDEIRPVELCMACFAPIIEQLHITVRPQDMAEFGPVTAQAVPAPPVHG